MILIDRTAPAENQAPRTAPETAPGAALAAALDGRLAALTSLEDRIRAIVAAIPGRVAFSSSLGIEDQAVTHAIAATGANIEIFTLDTGRHFPETYDTLFETEGRYGVKIRVIYPDAKDVEDLVNEDGIYGFRYSVDSRKACCDVRKVRPLNRAMKGANGWVTGLRREQSQGRAHVPFATFDSAQNVIKLNPIADWTLAQLEAFVAANSVPVNALHAQGFPSIGCQPCTRAIRAGEDIRAGRWWWENENGKECGLHTGQNNSDTDPTE
ncbi:MAG: phosphoadenylyl-sulfate reductase [Hyphomicrobium sp.]